MKFTIYSSNCAGNPGNCSYPHRHEVTDAESLKAAVGKDYVCAEYRNCYRNGKNFISSDCLPVDCDNDHSEDASDWITPSDVATAFPGVPFAVHYSRYNNREKNGRAARPKFHILFPIEPVTDPSVYADMKQLVNSIFPYFDSNALDSARFFFGTPEPEVEIHEGETLLSEFIKADDFDDGFGRNEIREGSRNATMSRFAGKLIKRLGDTDEAFAAFIEKSNECVPPLENRELINIWNSARKFYAKISKLDGYVPPEEYSDSASYKPDDFSDVGQAEVLARCFSGELRYSPATRFIRYSENYWQETEPGAQAVAHELTRRQMKEAVSLMASATRKLSSTGADGIIASASKAKAGAIMNAEQQEAYKDFCSAMEYSKFVTRRRESKNITATLKEARPMLEISPRDLDNNPYLLNAPSATFDIRKGMEGGREHAPGDFITKITSVSPGSKGGELWLECLDKIFCGDNELIEYVQLICGLAAVGKVFMEALIIAYGSGRNGKSTFWNTVSRVLGSYSGNISADTLTSSCRRNVKPELAEAKGKRLLIAAEMQEGARLSESVVKQLCSTDEIFAEKKYKDPFSFTPCHTLVLYTNHLPRVSASDDGTWRRLIVIPFNAKIEGDGDVKNYADYLYDNAGDSVLAWILEGAKKAYEKNFKIKEPRIVREAIDEYREQNDWFRHFLDDRCETGKGLRESSGELYRAYRQYALETNEFCRSTTDFYFALEKEGFQRSILKGRKYYLGIKLKTDTEDFDDFLL